MTHDLPLPQYLRLLTVHPTETPLPRVVGAMLDAGTVGAALSAWELSDSPEPSRQGRQALEQSLGGDMTGRDHYVKLFFDSGMEVTGARQGNGWTVDSMCFARAGEAAMRRWLAHALVIARHLVPALPTLAAEVVRSPSAGGFFIPEPPIARMRHLWMTSDAQIAEYYGAELRVFERAWDETHSSGNHKIVIRAADRVTEPQWVESVLDGQLRLARAAQAGQTLWHRAVLTDWNRHWLAAPHASLNFVGYDPSRERVEFTAVTSGRGLAIGELQMLHELHATGRDGAGRPVRTIDVVYLDADAAKPDLVPLTDLAISALCYQPDGRLMKLN